MFQNIILHILVIYCKRIKAVSVLCYITKAIFYFTEFLEQVRVQIFLSALFGNDHVDKDRLKKTN